ncbi:fibronectin type III domain-containing protein [Streptomyces sp. NBC_00444]|uniref:fibronectin type III domain-containing protein n=1 Tax=Streptomyces sp. NBC_00444 TaxID=2975744 RepID=UPI002E1F2F55
MNSARRTTTATAVALATAGGLLSTIATTPASAAVSCTSPVFKRQFFANTTFSGTPKKTDCDTTIDQKWSGAPTSGLPSNNFGVRWTVTRDFGSGGPFALNASALDGIRVYVDGVRKIDLWKNTSTTVSKAVNVTIPSGKHSIRVDYVNWTGSASVKFAYTPRTSATVDKVKPLTPTGTSLSYDQATGKAKLTWAKNKEMDLAGYRVYRRLKGSSYPGTPLATTTSTSYTNSPPPTGDTYYYEVRAVDKAGNVSTGTADQPVTTVDSTAPGAPKSLVAKSTKAANSLSWQAASGATSYEVYRASNADGPFTRIAVTGSAAYDDKDATADVPFAYKVRALDAAGNISVFSAVVWATRDTVAPAVPQGVDVVAEDEDGVTLTWQSIGSDAAAYRVYRSTSSQSYGTLVGTTQTVTYRDTTGVAGETYIYVVTAVDAAGNESHAGARVPGTRTVGPSSAPGAPALSILADVGSDRISLVWNQSGAVPVSGYTVYRSRTTPVDTTNASNVYATTTARSYEMTATADDRAYYYAVVATSTYGIRSAPSNSVLPPAGGGQVETRPPGPTEVYEVVPGDGQVRLTWAIVASPNGQSPVTGYRVYRSTSPGVTKENAEATYDTADHRHTDTGLTNGTTYYYAVATLNQAGLESALSPEVSATPGT